MKPSKEGLSSLLASYLALHHSRQPPQSYLLFNCVSVCHTPLCLSYAFIYLFIFVNKER